MSQSEGPVYTMDELAAYFASPSPRKPLLNVVSLDLANTLLHDLVIWRNLDELMLVFFRSCDDLLAFSVYLKKCKVFLTIGTM